MNKGLLIGLIIIVFLLVMGVLYYTISMSSSAASPPTNFTPTSSTPPPPVVSPFIGKWDQGVITDLGNGNISIDCCGNLTGVKGTVNGNSIQANFDNAGCCTGTYSNGRIDWSNKTWWNKI